MFNHSPAINVWRMRVTTVFPLIGMETTSSCVQVEITWDKRLGLLPSIKLSLSLQEARETQSLRQARWCLDIDENYGHPPQPHTVLMYIDQVPQSDSIGQRIATCPCVCVWVCVSVLGMQDFSLHCDVAVATVMGAGINRVSMAQTVWILCLYRGRALQVSTADWPLLGNCLKNPANSISSPETPIHHVSHILLLKQCDICSLCTICAFDH